MSFTRAVAVSVNGLHGRQESTTMSHPKNSSAPLVKRMPKHIYEEELERLQIQLVSMQQWVIETGARVVVIFEGRDAAGKGGAIKRIVQYLNPRAARVAALPTPNEREKGQWYFQRYIEHLPTAGEIVLMDRSWYNRAGVERVMDYCTPEQYRRFLHQVTKWEDYSRAKDAMFEATDHADAPWWTIESDDKRAARLNTISHLLSQVPWEPREPAEVAIPPRPTADEYERPDRDRYKYVPDHAARLGKR
jgi:polyphosphate kinase 2 (PPK2 family)